MALSTWGSPMIFATPKPRMPATRPAIIPRMSNPRTMVLSLSRVEPKRSDEPGSVAGKAKKVARVVHEVVHDVAADEGRCSLLGADDVQQEQHHHADEDRPRHELADGNRDGRGFHVREGCGVSHIRSPLGLRVPCGLSWRCRV